MWLPELGLYYFKSRVYSSRLGRFLQPDPSGYGGGMNLYSYSVADPVNLLDPNGTETWVIDCSRAFNDAECLRDWEAAGDDPSKRWGVCDAAGYPVCVPASQYYNNLASSLSAWANTSYFSSDDATIPTPRNIYRTLARAGIALFRRGMCALPSGELGLGFDAYYFVGGSGGGGVSFDPGTGEFGLSGNLDVGLGMGGDAGMYGGATFESGGGSGGYGHLNGTTSVGGASGLGATVTHSWVGTDQGKTTTTVGKLGAGVFANAGAQFGFSTPKLYDLGCHR
jgi:RHS repeat-associated protein